MNIHLEVMKQMQEMAHKFAQSGVELVMPPPSNATLGTVYVGIEQGVSLTAEIPFDKKFANPLLTFQGGFLAAAFDAGV